MDSLIGNDEIECRFSLTSILIHARIGLDLETGNNPQVTRRTEMTVKQKLIRRRRIGDLIRLGIPKQKAVRVVDNMICEKGNSVLKLGA